MKKKLKVSILIANYNNEQFIDQCIKSLLNQSYKNIEIIFHDDSSSDNSLKKISKYKKIKIIRNKVRGKFGSYNQLNACERSFKKSQGDIIFFLDSDDFFKKNKINNIVKAFNSNKDLDAIFDLPIFNYDKKNYFIKNKKKIVSNFWPYVPPQSCISIRRKNLKKIFKSINFRKYPDIWMDFRIAIYLKYISKNFYVLNDNLTYYRQTANTVSSKFKYLSKPWWIRRMQAHNYIEYYFRKNNVLYQRNFDFYLTKIINKLL